MCFIIEGCGIYSIGQDLYIADMLLIDQPGLIFTGTNQCKIKAVEYRFVAAHTVIFYAVKYFLYAGSGFYSAFPVQRVGIRQVQYARHIWICCKVLCHSQVLHMYGIKLVLLQQFGYFAMHSCRFEIGYLKWCTACNGLQHITIAFHFGQAYQVHRFKYLFQFRKVLQIAFIF
ncbi:hypothetical protein D3C86_1519520 [compost metagenome]